MSHIARIVSELTNFAVLRSCLPSIGLEMVEQSTFRSYSKSKCEFAIRIPGNDTAYEVGVVLNKKTNEYTLLFDPFCGAGGMEAVCGSACEKIIQAYKAELVRTSEDAQSWMNNLNCVEHLVTDPVTNAQYLVYEDENMSDQDANQYVLQR